MQGALLRARVVVSPGDHLDNLKSKQTLTPPLKPTTSNYKCTQRVPAGFLIRDGRPLLMVFNQLINGPIFINGYLMVNGPVGTN